MLSGDDESGYERELATSGLGTPLWIAPEVTTNSRNGRSSYSTPADVYSFGVVLYEIATRELPWHTLESASVFKLRGLVEAGQRPPLPPDPRLPVGFRELMDQCWQQASKSFPCLLLAYRADAQQL